MRRYLLMYALARIDLIWFGEELVSVFCCKVGYWFVSVGAGAVEVCFATGEAGFELFWEPAMTLRRDLLSITQFLSTIFTLRTII